MDDLWVGFPDDFCSKMWKAKKNKRLTDGFNSAKMDWGGLSRDQAANRIHKFISSTQDCHMVRCMLLVDCHMSHVWLVLVGNQMAVFTPSQSRPWRDCIFSTFLILMQFQGGCFSPVGYFGEVPEVIKLPDHLMIFDVNYCWWLKSCTSL